MARFDADAKFVVPLPPRLREFAEPLVGRERESDRFELMLCDRHWIVEEDHHPVAGEVLQRASMERDQFSPNLRR